MILKYRDTDDNWNWIDGIRHFRKVADPSSLEEICSIGSGGDPIFMDVTFKNGDKISYSMNVREAYICNDINGSTIDVIKGLNS